MSVRVLENANEIRPENEKLLFPSLKDPIVFR